MMVLAVKIQYILAVLFFSANGVGYVMVLKSLKRGKK